MKRILTIILETSISPTQLWLCIGSTHISYEFGTEKEAISNTHDPSPEAKHVHLINEQGQIKASTDKMLAVPLLSWIYVKLNYLKFGGIHNHRVIATFVDNKLTMIAELQTTWTKDEVVKLIGKYWHDEMSTQGKSVGFAAWIKTNIN